VTSTVPTEQDVRSLVTAVVAAVAPETHEARQAPPRSDQTQAVPLADVAMGADHGGYRLKERIAADLRKHGFTVHDCGTDSAQSVDYPDFAHTVARLVVHGGARWGIVVDGAGIGSAIAANKVPGVRAAPCWDISSARSSREHNHANVLALGAGLIGDFLALQIVQAWLSTPWGGDRHARRVDKITEIERQYART